MRLLILILLFSVSVQGQIIRANSFYRVAPAIGCPTEASAFISATGITGTDSAAICELVKDLKDSSLWTSLYAAYPFIGETAGTQKWNLIDPRDLDAAFRLTFTGGWTHNASGAEPNGTNGYANTYYAPSAHATATSRHISFYSSEDVQTGRDMGSSDGSFNGDLLHIEYTDGNTYGQVGSTAGSATAGNSADYYIGSRINNTDSRIYKDGVLLITKTSANIFTSTHNIYLGNINYAGVPGALYSNRQIWFASMGAGLTAAQAATLNLIIKEFCTAIGRSF